MQFRVAVENTDCSFVLLFSSAENTDVVFAKLTSLLASKFSRPLETICKHWNSWIAKRDAEKKTGRVQNQLKDIGTQGVQVEIFGGDKQS